MDEKETTYDFLSDDELEEVVSEAVSATEDTDTQDDSSQPDVASLQARIEQLEAELKQAQYAREFYEQFTDPQRAPQAVEALLNWAKSQGYWKPEDDEDDHVRSRSSSSFWDDEDDEGRGSDVEKKIAELERELQSLLYQRQREEAVSYAKRLIIGWGATEQEAMQVIEEASQLVRPDMDNATVEKILRMVYNNRAGSRRDVGQSDTAEMRAMRPMMAPKVRVDSSGGSTEEDLFARMDRVLQEYLGKE